MNLSILTRNSRKNITHLDLEILIWEKGAKKKTMKILRRWKKNLLGEVSKRLLPRDDDGINAPYTVINASHLLYSYFSIVILHFEVWIV